MNRQSAVQSTRGQESEEERMRRLDKEAEARADAEGMTRHKLDITPPADVDDGAGDRDKEERD